eukprot:scaffold18803_cov146-Isochrysis_galbana.AAC.1
MVCTMLRGCAAPPGCCSGCSMVRSAAWVYQKLKQNCWREPRGAWREIDQGRRGGAAAQAPCVLCGLWRPVRPLHDGQQAAINHRAAATRHHQSIGGSRNWEDGRSTGK